MHVQYACMCVLVNLCECVCFISALPTPSSLLIAAARPYPSGEVKIDAAHLLEWGYKRQRWTVHSPSSSSSSSSLFLTAHSFCFLPLWCTYTVSYTVSCVFFPSVHLSICVCLSVFLHPPYLSGTKSCSKTRPCHVPRWGLISYWLAPFVNTTHPHNLEHSPAVLSAHPTSACSAPHHHPLWSPLHTSNTLLLLMPFKL